MNGSGDEAQDVLKAHAQAQAIPRQGDANGEPAPVELGALCDADEMGSSENQPSSNAGVTAPDTSREVHNPLGFSPNEPQGCTDGLVIPTPGFTSAFYYDPYVEIKDFLDALKSGVNFHVGAAGQEDQSGSVENGTAARQQNEILSESHSGVLNEEPQVPTSQPGSAMPEAYDTNPAMISAESDTTLTFGAGNTVGSGSKVTQQSLAAEAKSSADNGKAIEETPPAAAPASDPNEDAPSREHSSSSSSEAAESPSEYTAASHELETVSKESETPQDDDTQEHCGSLEQQQRIQSTGANQHTPTAAPVRSSHSQPLGFAASLTASFAPETKSAWAQLFGSKYEDEIGPKSAARLSSSAFHHDDGLDQSEEKDNLTEGRLSLKAKLERERKLDQQIQASQQKFKERSLRKASSTTRQQQQSPKRQGISYSTASIPFKPFEMAGLSITNVRFCVEKALQATCKCFQQLHALALNEPRIPKAEAEHGVFVSQWELEWLLQDLFGPPRQEDTKTTTSLSHLSCFPLTDPQFAGIPLELLLQVTWFLPFDQLTRLRSLVLQITRKHLNEHKLAVLNRHLQKQLLLIPYSTKLQQVLLQFSGHRPHHNKYDPDDDDVEEKENSLVSTAPPLVNCTAHLVHDLLECIAVPVQAELVTALGDKDFLLLSPFELVQKWRLSSLLCIQRVIFFRFFVEALASERAFPTTTAINRNGKLQTAHRRELSRSASQSVRSVQLRTKAPATIVAGACVKQKAKTKKKRKNMKPSQSASSVSGESESERSEKLRISRASVITTQGSTTSLLSSNNDDHTDKISGSGTGTKQQQLQSLQRKLLASLNRLEEVIPWLLRSNESGSPAIKATYLAASAFYQSLEIMIKSHLVLDCDIMDKLQHFIEAIGALIIAAEHAAPLSDPPASAPQSRMPLPHPAVAAATTVVPSGGDGSSGRFEEFPPPFPDLTKEQEKARFPPPYETSGTSYWAFKPDLPQPSAAVASVTKPSVIHPTLYPVHPSPGVGAYDIQRSDRVTFQQKPGHSFRKAEISGGGNGVGTPTPSNDPAVSLSSTLSKPRIYKGSASACQSSSPAVVVLPSHNSPELSDRESPRHSVEVGVESKSRPEPQYDNDDDDERLEVDILNALRRQHNMVVNDFAQDILLQHHHKEHQLPQPPPSYNSPVSISPVKANATTHSRKARTAVEAHEPMWKMSTSESRFVSRIRGRESTVDAPSSSPVVDLSQHKELRSSSMRPQSARASTTKPVVTKPASSVKPRSKKRRQQRSYLSETMKIPFVNGQDQPNDEHLAWAARISDFYRARRDLDDE